MKLLCISSERASSGDACDAFIMYINGVNCSSKIRINGLLNIVHFNEIMLIPKVVSKEFAVDST